MSWFKGKVGMILLSGLVGGIAVAGFVFYMLKPDWLGFGGAVGTPAAGECWATCTDYTDCATGLACKFVGYTADPDNLRIRYTRAVVEKGLGDALVMRAGRRGPADAGRRDRREACDWFRRSVEGFAALAAIDDLFLKEDADTVDAARRSLAGCATEGL